MAKLLLLIYLIHSARAGKYVTTKNLPARTGADLQCNLSADLREEIENHSDAIQRIADFVLRGPERHRTYELLAKFTDQFGARPVGSLALENAIDHIEEILLQEEMDKVHTEIVPVRRWIRGREFALMTQPFRKQLTVLALGGSVSTPEGGLHAEALVVKSFHELREKRDQVLGKIVIYAYDFKSYSTAYSYRNAGARTASHYGALAALVRSATDYSLYTPHTGDQNYGNETGIPVACITVEDAEMFARMAERGQQIILHLDITTETLNQSISRNLVADLTGTKHPQQLVVVGGHTDSWDVGQGALDDGGGVFISWRSLVLLKRLGLLPKRTIRTVLWTAEEVGLLGAKHYYEAHMEEQPNISIALESDYGTFEPLGLAMKHNSNTTLCIVRQVLTLFQNINNATLLLQVAEGPDLKFWRDSGIPTGSLLSHNKDYFRYHHTDADTVSVLNKDALDLCTAFWTGLVYVFANLEDLLPRT